MKLKELGYKIEKEKEYGYTEKESSKVKRILVSSLLDSLKEIYEDNFKQENGLIVNGVKTRLEIKAEKEKDLYNDFSVTTKVPFELDEKPINYVLYVLDSHAHFNFCEEMPLYTRYDFVVGDAIIKDLSGLFVHSKALGKQNKTKKLKNHQKTINEKLKEYNLKN